MWWLLLEIHADAVCNTHLHCTPPTYSLSLQLPNVTEIDARQVFEIIDADGSGYIDFKEFVAWWSNQLKKDPSNE